VASPTQRTLALLRKRGCLAATVERWNPYAKIRQDLFGFGDVIYCGDGIGIGLVQTTTASNVASRRAKVLASEKAAAWLRAGGKIKRGGVAYRWICNEEEIGLADFACAREAGQLAGPLR